MKTLTFLTLLFVSLIYFILCHSTRRDFVTCCRAFDACVTGNVQACDEKWVCYPETLFWAAV